MPAVWFHVHPFPKQALSVRTMVTAGVIVTSWGPEWDNWLLFVSRRWIEGCVHCAKIQNCALMISSFFLYT